MAKISALTAASTLDGTELSPAVQSGGTVRTTLQAIANLWKGTKGADLASGATVNIGAATGNVVHITGTTTITAFDNVAQGIERTLVFDGALTLTHNSTSLILPTGANITTAAGDTARFMSEGSGNWRCLAYNRKNGQALAVGSSASATTALSISSGTVTIDLGGGVNRNFTLALTANVTSISFSNLPASGFVGEIEIEFKQDATGSRTVALPSSFKALGPSDTSVASAANAVTVLSAKTWDQGTTWRYAMQESA